MDNSSTVQLQPKKAGAFAKFMRWFIFIGLVIVGFIFWWKYYYVFGEGVKSGELNYVVKKGNIFKTYEGKLIQSGFRAQTVAAFSLMNLNFQ